MASCNKIPGQPGPRTTVMAPAGAATASRFDQGLPHGLAPVREGLVAAQQLIEAEAAAAAAVALLATAVLFDDDGNVHTAPRDERRPPGCRRSRRSI